MGANANHLAAVAVSRLQGELAKDGSEPSAAFGGMQGKSFSGKAAIVKYSEKRKGKKFYFFQNLDCSIGFQFKKGED